MIAECETFGLWLSLHLLSLFNKFHRNCYFSLVLYYTLAMLLIFFFSRWKAPSTFQSVYTYWQYLCFKKSDKLYHLHFPVELRTNTY